MTDRLAVVALLPMTEHVVPAEIKTHLALPP